MGTFIYWCICIVIGLGIAGIIACCVAAYERRNQDDYSDPCYGTWSPNTTSPPSESWRREQRNRMNRKYSNGMTLRQYILYRDNYTCQCCGNSKQKEPNLLLEVDHIKPVSKWGQSVPQNLQTLCWKCNRSKSNK